MRRVSGTSAAALVVGNMLGVGVFTTSGFALADLGRRDAVLLAWLVGGLIALFGALSYGALARRIPESGGEYTFLAVTVHPLAGFAAGWVSLLAGFTAPLAAAGLALEAYVGGDPTGASGGWIGTAAIVAAGLAHGLRLRLGLLAQNIAVAAKLAAIAGLLALGAALVPEGPIEAAPDPAVVSPGAFGMTLVWISFAYSGWNAAVYIGGEVRDPERSLPRALALATLLVTILHVGLNAVFLYAAPVSVLAGRADVAAVAAEALGGAPLQAVVSALVALALMTSISAMMMAGPRVTACMARDGLLPARLASGGDAPTAAVVLQVMLAVTVLHIGTLAGLLGAIGFLLGLSASASVAGLVALRMREGAARVPIPGYPWVPGAFVAATLAASLLMAVRQPIEALTALAVVAAGLPVYALLRVRSRGSNERTSPGRRPSPPLRPAGDAWPRGRPARGPASPAAARGTRRL